MAEVFLDRRRLSRRRARRSSSVSSVGTASFSSAASGDLVRNAFLEEERRRDVRPNNVEDELPKDILLRPLVDLLADMLLRIDTLALSSLFMFNSSDDDMSKPGTVS